MKYYLSILIVIASCNEIIYNNQALIKATLDAHAATKSLKIKDYKVENYLDRSDTSFFYIQGHYSNDVSFSDTLKFAKSGDSLAISK